MIPNIDAVQEFKVVGQDAKAEFGGAMGGVMNMVSRSGGNTFHGSAFEYVRNDAFDARNSFDVCTTARCGTATGVPKKPLPFRQNQFGGVVSGPIIKNQTFFRSATMAGAIASPDSDCLMCRPLLRSPATSPIRRFGNRYSILTQPDRWAPALCAIHSVVTPPAIHCR